MLVHIFRRREKGFEAEFIAYISGFSLFNPPFVHRKIDCHGTLAASTAWNKLKVQTNTRQKDTQSVGKSSGRDNYP
jgi:hypothetical protein